VSDSPFPRLDLAPKLNRPLRLWWPPDYLRLLYWAFFFPQAIRWYVERFGSSEYRGVEDRKAVAAALRHDQTQRRLVVQAAICVLLTAPAITWLLGVIGVPVIWIGIAASLVSGLAMGVAGGVAGGVTGGVAIGVVFGMAVGVLFGTVFGILVSVAVSVVSGLMFGVVGGVGLSVAYAGVAGLAFSVVAGVAAGVAGRVVAGMTFCVAIGAAFGITIGMVLGRAFGLAFSVASCIAACFAAGVAASRLLDWILLGLPARLVGKLGWAGRMVWLPLPGVQRELEARLAQDWTAGSQGVNDVLAYTLQFIPAVRAVNAALVASPTASLLERVSTLVDKPYSWDLVRFGSASLRNGLWRQAILGLLPFGAINLRRRWQGKYPIEPLLAGPSRAACAGFWYWHEAKIVSAMNAFAVVRDMHHGQELHNIACAIASAQAAGDLDAITICMAAFQPLWTLPDPELRPGTLRVLHVLNEVADEARVARHSMSALSRSAALGRANAKLTNLLERGGEICPEPEWPLIKKITEQWRDIVSKAGGVIGDEVLRQSVRNPYEGYSGLPVTGPTFIGRENILRHIGDRWAGEVQPPPLILFGHRRMGKSSILRNLHRIADTRAIVVYQDMQDTGWINHTGELLLDLAEAIHRRVREAGLDAGQSPTDVGYADLGTARRSLNALLDHLDCQMIGFRLILAIDEYEIIEKGIEDGRIDPDLPGYLRAKVSQYRWLALIFAGLHTLEEMGHDYQAAFGSAAAEHTRVGYLSHDDAIRLIAQPNPDFVLEYEPELREELYRLTYGQPYLLQRLCWELVNNWNEQFLREGESTPRILTLDDLAPVLTPDFYQAAGYYFDGVWTNVTDAERQLMRVMAGRAEGTWTPAELGEAAGLSEGAVLASLELLRRHDVIMDEGGGVRFAAELMRRWVA
jgi:hypothetical protein